MTTAYPRTAPTGHAAELSGASGHANERGQPRSMPHSGAASRLRALSDPPPAPGTSFQKMHSLILASCHAPSVMAPRSRYFVALIVGGLLSTGSVNTLVKKLAYDMKAVGRGGALESFKKVRCAVAGARAWRGAARQG